MLWISAPHLGSVSPCFGLSNILRIAFVGAARCPLYIVQGIHGETLPSYATCFGCLIRGDTTALAELIKATVVANVHSETRHVCSVHVTVQILVHNTTSDGGCFS